MAELPDPLLSAKEVSKLLSVSVPTLYRLMGKGAIKRPLKLGGSSRWPRSEVLSVIEAAKARRSA